MVGVGLEDCARIRSVAGEEPEREGAGLGVGSGARSGVVNEPALGT